MMVWLNRFQFQACEFMAQKSDSSFYTEYRGIGI